MEARAGHLTRILKVVSNLTRVNRSYLKIRIFSDLSDLSPYPTEEPSLENRRVTKKRKGVQLPLS